VLVDIKQENLANAKASARQLCLYEGP